MTVLLTFLVLDALYTEIAIPLWAYTGIAIAWVIWNSFDAMDGVTALYRIVQFQHLLRRMKQDVRSERRSTSKARSTYGRVRRRISNVLHRPER